MTVKYRFLHSSAKYQLAGGVVSVTMLMAIAISLGTVRGYRTLTTILLMVGLPSTILVFCAGLIGTILRFYRYEFVSSRNRCAVISYLVLSIFACIGGIISALLSGYFASWGATKGEERCFGIIPLTLSSIVDAAIAVWAAICCCQPGLCTSDGQHTSRLQAGQAVYVIDQTIGQAGYVIFPARSQASLLGAVGVAPQTGQGQIAFVIHEPEEYWNPVFPSTNLDPPPAYEEHNGEILGLHLAPVPSPPAYEIQSSHQTSGDSASVQTQSDNTGIAEEPDHQTTHL